MIRIFLILFFPIFVFSQTKVVVRKEIQDYSTVSNLQNSAIKPTKNDKVFVKETESLYYYDSADLTSNDDGLNVIKQGNYRWKLINKISADTWYKSGNDIINKNSGNVGIGGNTTKTGTKLYIESDKYNADHSMPYTLFLNKKYEGGTEYDGENHLALQAGITRDYRRYIIWNNYQSQLMWAQGINASNTYIHYDAYGGHRMWITSGQNSYTAISAAKGSGNVRLNWHPTDSLGTGGLTVYDGKPNSTTPYVNIGADGLYIYNGQIKLQKDKNEDSYITINSGLSSSYKSWFLFKDKNVEKWAIGKNQDNSFKVYDYNFGYLLSSPSGSGNLGIDIITPSQKLDVGGNIKAYSYLFATQNPIDGTGVANGSIFYGTDGALYFKGGSGTVTKIANP